jgi:hypothetical protein
MPTVVLDPGLLAYVQSMSRADLLVKVEQLVIWSKISATHFWVTVTLPPSARETLEVSEFIPAYESAKRLLESTGLRNVYSPEDLIRPVYDLLEKASPAAFCCVADEMHDQFKSDPPQPWHGDNPSIEALSQRALLMSSLENQIHEEKKLRYFASVIKSETIEFAALLELIDPNTLPGFGVEDMPKNVHDQFQHVWSIEDVLSTIDPGEIWKNASSSREIKLAIQLACRNRMIAEGTYSTLDKIPSFFVGGDFLESLKAWQADEDHRFAIQTLESCAAAVLNLPTIEIKPFYTKAKRAADSADPLRAHISKAGVGLRLMMWLRPAAPRCIEFANVGGKNEEEIVYSAPSSAV